MRPSAHHSSCMCRKCEARRNRFSWGFWLVITVVSWVLLFLLLTGCAGPVVPRPVESQQASFDGNEQNSGIVAASPAGYFVTNHFRDRYNELVKTYGRDFHPALKADDGLSPFPLPPTGWHIDKEHMQKFLQMKAWQRAGINALNE